MTGAEAKAAIKKTTTMRALSTEWGKTKTYVSQVLNGNVTSQPTLNMIEDWLGILRGTIKVESREHYKKYQYWRSIKQKHLGIKAWKCRCPKCRETHKVKMYYTGNLKVPWIMCKACKVANSSEWEMSAQVHGSGRRV